MCSLSSITRTGVSIQCTFRSDIPVFRETFAPLTDMEDGNDAGGHTGSAVAVLRTQGGCRTFAFDAKRSRLDEVIFDIIVLSLMLIERRA